MKILHDHFPLFPLQTVLFPQSRLPLHIFEPRYQEMIERCLKEDMAFGIVLIREGQEVGKPAIPRSVGTVARIGDVARLSEGRMNLVAIGVMRFRLVEVSTELAYLTGRIQLMPDDNYDLAKVEPVAGRAAKLFEQYVRSIQEAAGVQEDQEERTFEPPKDPAVLSYLIASNLQISQSDKQTLLEVPTVGARLRREMMLIERELELLRRVREGIGQVKDQGTFSMN